MTPEPDTPTLHAQRVRPARLGVILAVLAFVPGAVGAGINLAGGSIWAVLLLTLGMLLFTMLASVFWELEICVRADHLEFGWGRPLRRRLNIADISAARAEPYKAARFGGWGWRLGRGGAWAYSDPGLKQALVLVTRDGREIHVTLPDAEAAARAVAALLAAPAAQPSPPHQPPSP
ncbi:MAG: hypothetical protein HS108_12175 [Planctomycetes bacterium]|nr:hypothetical protein [Planctomycetota bacterium]MCL4730305.1 hypothetical protein [Planctomycetota bacterium]